MAHVLKEMFLAEDPKLGFKMTKPRPRDPKDLLEELSDFFIANPPSGTTPKKPVSDAEDDVFSDESDDNYERIIGGFEQEMGDEEDDPTLCVPITKMSWQDAAGVSIDPGRGIAGSTPTEAEIEQLRPLIDAFDDFLHDGEHPKTKLPDVALPPWLKNESGVIISDSIDAIHKLRERIDKLDADDVIPIPKPQKARPPHPGSQPAQLGRPKMKHVFGQDHSRSIGPRGAKPGRPVGSKDSSQRMRRTKAEIPEDED